MEKILHTLEELASEAERFARALVPSVAGATLVTLSGELGAGKTAFTQAVARALGVEEHVTSPTFVLEKIYDLPLDSARGENASAFSRLVHIDAYRLKSGAELAALGFDELMRDPKNLVLLEWPERVADALPPPAVALAFEVLADGSRKLKSV